MKCTFSPLLDWLLDIPTLFVIAQFPRHYFGGSERRNQRDRSVSFLLLMSAGRVRYFIVNALSIVKVISVSYLVSWCFETSKPRRITSGPVSYTHLTLPTSDGV